MQILYHHFFGKSVQLLFSQLLSHSLPVRLFTTLRNLLLQSSLASCNYGARHSGDRCRNRQRCLLGIITFDKPRNKAPLVRLHCRYAVARQQHIVGNFRWQRAIDSDAGRVTEETSSFSTAVDALFSERQKDMQSYPGVLNVDLFVATTISHEAAS